MRTTHTGTQNQYQAKRLTATKIIVTAMLCGFTLNSCDDHTAIDANIYTGHILCTDGSVITEGEMEQQGKTAAAVVFYSSYTDTESEVLAVGLTELKAMTFSDTIGVSQGTSADTDAMDGNSNTYNLFSNTKAYSELANAVFDIWTYGQSAYIPSVAELRLLEAVREQVNPIIKRCGGDTISTAASSCWYWSSTEVSGQEDAKAWLFSLGSGTMHETPKTEAHPARYIVKIEK